MATKKTAIKFEDRDRLIEILRPLAEKAGDRYNLTSLAGKALEVIEATVDDSDDVESYDWLERTKRHALADRCYTELDLLLKARQIKVTLPFMKQPIVLNPHQGVRLPGMKEYQQIKFVLMTWDEYEAWREDQINRFERAAEMRNVITLIDRVRMIKPDVANIGEALRIGGAKVEAVYEEGAA